jgi:iron complex outermembrane recepter protein
MSGSIGGTTFFRAGRAGVAVSRFENDYGVPTGDDPAVSLRIRRMRVDLAGELTQPFGPFRGATAKLGFGDYKHAELSGGTTVNTTFINKAWEGRLELPHAPIGRITGTLGVQAARSDLSAFGEEVVTPGSLTQNAAVFALEAFKLNELTTLELGGRLEAGTIKVREVDPDLPRVAGYRARSGQKKKFAGASSSLGLVFRPAKDWAVAASLAYTERLPTAQELFSNGPHGGTGAYEVGTSGLGNERSIGVDVSVRRRAGFATGSVGVFLNRFRDFIFERELPDSTIPRANNPEGLTPFQFVATDARYYGAEAELLLHLIEKDRGRLHLALNSDFVRATDTNTHQPLPRIPPHRYGARLNFEDGRWHAVIEVRHVARQDQTAEHESPTDRYTLLNASVGFLIPGKRVSYELFARGHNLTDEEAREHTSFLKEFAPLPGRGVLAGIRVTF